MRLPGDLELEQGAGAIGEGQHHADDNEEYQKPGAGTPGRLVATSDAATSPVVIDTTPKASARSGDAGSLTTVIAATSIEPEADDKDIAWVTSPAGRVVSATYSSENVRGAVEHAVVACQRRWRERLRRARFACNKIFYARLRLARWRNGDRICGQGQAIREPHHRVTE